MKARILRVGLWICLLFFSIPQSVNAIIFTGTDENSISINPKEVASEYSSVLYDNKNGLPTSEANAITQTSEGFIWIGSYSGLIRYDGNTFERIDSFPGVASVISLYVDSNERLWVGTNDNGIAVIEKGECQIFHKEEGLAASSVRSITEDKNGNIYAATTGGISIIDKNMNVHSIDNPQIKNAYVTQLYIGANNIIYGVTIEGNIFTIEEEKLSGFYSGQQLGIEGVISILPDLEKPGYIYIGTENSTIYYGILNGQFQTMDIQPLSYVKSMEKFQDMLWICTDKGIGMIQNGKFVKVDDVPLNNSVEQVMPDYQGNLWFVSTRQGVMKIVKNQFFDIFERNKITSDVVNSTCLKDNYLYIGTDSGLLVMDDTTGELVDHIAIHQIISSQPIKENNLITLLKNVRIRSIIKDSKGRIWFSTWKKIGLLCLDNDVLTVYDESDGLPSNRIRTVEERKDGSIMVACTGGVAIIQNGIVTNVYGQSVGIENTEVLTVVEDCNGNIVIGTDGGGIYVIDGSNTIHIGAESGLVSDVVMRLKRDNTRDICWIVTSNSLAYMDKQYHVETIQNFPYSNNFDLYENSRGEIWVLSSDGVYVTTAEELLKNEKISTIHYGRDNGLSYTTTGNSYSELSEKGDLYISGTTGVAKVNIEDSFENVNDIKMAVPFVEVDGKVLYPQEDGSFKIASDTKKLTIHCCVYTYSLTNPQVSYYLEGFEKQPNKVNRSNLIPIDYTNLRGGHYHFIVTLKDAMGNGSREMTIAIEKEKAFYETIWFYVLSITGIVLFLVISVRHHVRRKIKKYQKKDEENRAVIRGITKAFAKVIDMKDRYTNGHSFRVAKYTAMLAKQLGYSEQQVERFYNIALLHDIGKIGIPEEVLNKQEQLTEEEFSVMKSHATLGYNALKEITIMPELADGAGFHHERPDGKGYRHVEGKDIPRVAQIIAVADAFDAMYSDRPYRKRMNFEKACSIIREGAGTQFEKDVVDAFLSLVAKGQFRAPDDVGGGTLLEVDNTTK